MPNEEGDRGDEAERRAYQQALVEFLKMSGRTQPLLVARFCARHVSEEVNKLVPPPATLSERSSLPEPAPGSPPYTFYDHLERLKYLEIEPLDMERLEKELIQDVLKKAVEGLEEIVSEDKYLLMKGKIAYNAIGVALAGGRGDRPEPKGRIETWEWSRTPHGTDRQIGAALYRVSPYLNHSCSPSVRPSFPTGTNELHLVANRAISSGEELTISYTCGRGDGDDSPEEARRKRRVKLARGWRFACECERCSGKKVETPPGECRPEPILQQPIPRAMSVDTDG